MDEFTPDKLSLNRSNQKNTAVTSLMGESFKIKKFEILSTDKNTPTASPHKLPLTIQPSGRDIDGIPQPHPIPAEAALTLAAF